MSDYTPTTEEVRNALIRSAPRDEWALRKTQFDRWIAEVKAQAWEEGCKTGFANARTDNTFVIPHNPYRQGEN